MQNKKEDMSAIFASRSYLARLKQIKKSLGKNCTFLANYTDSKGSRFVKTVVKGKEHYFTMPYDLTKVNDTDFNHLRELIQSKM